MEALDAALPRALRRPAAHPHDPSAAAGVEWVQTHLSHVFLTRERVYKLRKAVDLGFVRFDTRDARNADCLREVALNRRLAPDVYLGVAAVEPDPGAAADGGYRVGPVREALAEPGPDGAAAEHCVVMRRLPAGSDALSLLAADRLTGESLDATARTLARFHAAHRVGGPSDRETWQAALLAPVDANFESLAQAAVPGVDAPRVKALAEAARRAFAERAERFDARRRAGRIVDGHGDVHLQHVWFPPGAREPVLIDCIEFSEELRRIDAASEVAFLAMDLAYRERTDLAERFLRSYAAGADDYDLYGVVDWFASYRAGVRAKVAALAAADAAIPDAQRAAAAASARRHLDLAEAFLAPPASGALLLLCGTVGTGKSSVASAVADACGGAVVSSDVTRKHAVAGGRELYHERSKGEVYAALLERAAPVVASGRTAILDATFDLRERRDAARRFAQAHGVSVWLLEVDCAESVARERLARREAEGRDASDAGPSLLASSRARFEAPVEWPSAMRSRIETDRADWREAARELARRLPSRGRRAC